MEHIFVKKLWEIDFLFNFWGTKFCIAKPYRPPFSYNYLNSFYPNFENLTDYAASK